MKIYYVNSELPEKSLIENSIFLAGPTPREKAVPSWRPDAVSILEDVGFGGSVFIPETDDGDWLRHYDRQVEWEWSALAKATVVLFWIPRHLGEMPGFTTNVEFGLIAALKPKSAVLAFPEGAPKTRYLAELADQIEHFHNIFGSKSGLPPYCAIPRASTLRSALEICVNKAAHP